MTTDPMSKEQITFNRFPHTLQISVVAGLLPLRLDAFDETLEE